MKRKETTILYCARCRMSTPHAIAGHTYTCRRCGIDKTPVIRHRHGRDSGRMRRDGETVLN